MVLKLALCQTGKPSHCISAPIQQCSWGSPSSRSRSLNQLPLQCPQTQIPFLCVTLDKSYSLSFSAARLSALKLLLICLIWFLKCWLFHILWSGSGLQLEDDNSRRCVCQSLSFDFTCHHLHKLNSPFSSLQKKNQQMSTRNKQGRGPKNKVGYCVTHCKLCQTELHF